MQRPQLEHIIRAAAGITGTERFVVIGSQAILGQFPDSPMELLISVEADLVSLQSPNDADLIDGSIGEASPFHRTFGYYAHGVSAETAVLPEGWQERLIPIQNENTGGGAGLCLEVHDLAVSKLVAGREKDVSFIRGLLRHGLANPELISKRLEMAPLSSDWRETSLSRLHRLLTKT